MKTFIELTEKEVSDAVVEYLAKRGYKSNPMLYLFWIPFGKGTRK